MTLLGGDSWSRYRIAWKITLTFGFWLYPSWASGQKDEGRWIRRYLPRFSRFLTSRSRYHKRIRNWPNSGLWVVFRTSISEFRKILECLSTLSLSTLKSSNLLRVFQIHLQVIGLPFLCNFWDLLVYSSHHVTTLVYISGKSKICCVLWSSMRFVYENVFLGILICLWFSQLQDSITENNRIFLIYYLDLLRLVHLRVFKVVSREFLLTIFPIIVIPL